MLRNRNMSQVTTCSPRRCRSALRICMCAWLYPTYSKLHWNPFIGFWAPSQGGGWKFVHSYYFGYWRLQQLALPCIPWRTSNDLNDNGYNDSVRYDIQSPCLYPWMTLAIPSSVRSGHGCMTLFNFIYSRQPSGCLHGLGLCVGDNRDRPPVAQLTSDGTDQRSKRHYLLSVKYI